MQNARMDEAQAEIKIARRNSNNLRYADDTTFMTKREEELKSLLKVKEESEKVGLKLNIHIKTTMRYHFTPVRMAAIQKSTSKKMLEKVWRKGNSLTLLVGMQTSTATMKNSVEFP